MLIVEVTLGPSSIHGLGIFAKERIPKGSLVWVAHHGFDVYYNADQIEALHPRVKAYVEDHVYISTPRHNNPTNSVRHVMCGDQARYMNHSEQDYNLESAYFESRDDAVAKFGAEVMGSETVDWTEGANFALRDIEAGEELLCNYLEFDADAKRKLGM
eukprot:TRINITY_DN1005_c0_g1_i2.p1 TRINITY_DN1005_c0_g1~~TRINITY_DN1005_c0_g1_i2.p1  ORF type:complete len:158 (-),score=40.69 TRINITY_DN1005_c0_g1_i2:105-578(-)